MEMGKFTTYKRKALNSLGIAKRTKLMGLLCLLFSQETYAVDWCSLPCGTEPNTLCKYKPQTSAGDCTNIEGVTSAGMRKDLLALHNEYRDKIASGGITDKGVTWPFAGNMRQMSWDENLEELALRWAQQCSSSPPHDKCRRTPDFEYSGQNFAYESRTTDFPYVNGSFQLWVNEVSDTTPAIVDSYVFGKWGHFSQIIWAITYKLGCAVIHANEGAFKATIVMCNYGPGGNLQGGVTYSRSNAACTACPQGTQCYPNARYKSLCALPTDDRTPMDIPSKKRNDSPKNPQAIIGRLIFFIVIVFEI